MFSDRKIYQCPATGRYYDPLVLKRSLLAAAKGQYNRAVAEYPDEKARSILLTAGRVAFETEDPTSVPDETVLDAVTAFSKYLTAKRREYVDLADFVAVYGFPETDKPIDYDVFVGLSLCLRRAQLRQARAMVTAAGIANGGLGDPEYYALDSVDPTEATRAYQEARCRTALTRLTRRGRTA